MPTTEPVTAVLETLDAPTEQIPILRRSRRRPRSWLRRAAVAVGYALATVAGVVLTLWCAYALAFLAVVVL